jgi:hypothetical protein
MWAGRKEKNRKIPFPIREKNRKIPFPIREKNRKISFLPREERKKSCFFPREKKTEKNTISVFFPGKEKSTPLKGGKEKVSLRSTRERSRATAYARQLLPLTVDRG